MRDLLCALVLSLISTQTLAALSASITLDTGQYWQCFTWREVTPLERSINDAYSDVFPVTACSATKHVATNSLIRDVL